MSENREPVRSCAFCGAPWTQRMTALLGVSQGCACCGGAIAGHWPIKAQPAVAPTQDLRCDACGKTLYTAP